MQEKWLKVPDYEDLYEVSNLAKVRNSKTLKIMSTPIDNHGYLRVPLRKEGVTKLKTLHRVVASAWIPNTFNKPYVNHKNGIKTDNSLENLEWCTAQENSAHAYRMGLSKMPSGEKNHMFNRVGEKNPKSKIIIDTNTGIFYFGVREAANAKGISIRNLYNRLQGYIINRTGLNYA